MLTFLTIDAPLYAMGKRCLSNGMLRKSACGNVYKTREKSTPL